MKKYFGALKNNPLFRGMNEDDMEAILENADARVKAVKENEYILRVGDTASEMGFSYTEQLHDIYQTCDVISVSVPLNEHTRNMISYKEIAMCKQNAILINASRGGIIHEEALMQALQENKIYGAAIDAFVEEPVSKDNALFRQFNFVGTPHNGANTRDALIKMGTGAVDEIVRVKNDMPVKHAV